MTPQQQRFLVSVSITYAHGGSWKKTQKPKIWSSKEAAVSPGMFTFRDGSLTVLPAAIAYTIHKRRMDLSMGGVSPTWQVVHRGLAEPTRA